MRISSTAVLLSETSSAELLRHPARRLGIWTLWLALLVFGLMILGGYVRLSGSGLSIPEWPIINGSLLPPLTEADWQAVYRTYHIVIEGVDPSQHYEGPAVGIIPMERFQVMFWIEYAHRFLAALVGIVFLALFLQVLRIASLRHRYGLRFTWLAVLLLVQAVLGGIVVKSDLKPEMVTAHLGMASLFLGLLIWTGLQMYDARQVRHTTSAYRWAVVALSATTLQILLGGLVAANYAGHFMNTFPTMGGYWIPPGLWSSDFQPAILNVFHNKVLVQFLHRWWAWGVFAAVTALVWVSWRAPGVSVRGRLLLRSVFSVLVLQLLLGIATLLLQVPIALGLMHQAVGFLLFAILVAITYELRYASVALPRAQ
ncbi:MAG: COX15/CtaA family protein [Bacteroidetes bacterium]|nr:COX15/CtaA family protein [Rhodothermia bacterium]MCS7154926.1 COX15/CtaA family protein [Bacteroidota bacterium]MCX7906915.1 COX15/CtaA family protein [Bacteroidota bacterium]MDW8137721.1 COX15/CtaA family protein [Bacteroidota bacterium]MDW8285325.1 COX15/CtaA family protein [Bacteroidota bacterium]